METIKRKIKVVMLPKITKHKTTNTGIFYYKKNNKIEENHNNQSKYREEPVKQNLYFISDEKIKEGDYYISESFTIDNRGVIVTQWKDKGNHYHEQPLGKKVIATTDKSLLVDTFICQGDTVKGDIITSRNGGNITSLKGRINLPCPTTDFIKAYCKQGGIDEVLVGYEVNTITKGTSEFNFYEEDVTTIKVNKYNEITIHPVKISWSKEEVEELCRKAFNQGERGEGDTSSYMYFEDWVEKNL